MAATAMRSVAGLDTGLAGTQGLHLFFGGRLRGAQDGAVSPFEVAAIRIMPQPRHSPFRRAVEMYRLDHVPDVRMFHRARHGNCLRAILVYRCGLGSSQPGERPQLAPTGSSTLTVLAVSYALQIIVGSCMVVRRIGAHAAHYVSADGRRLVASALALQLVDDVLRSEGLPAGTSPDSWKHGADLITSSHQQSLHRAEPGFYRPHVPRRACISLVRSQRRRCSLPCKTALARCGGHEAAAEAPESG